MPGNCDDTSDVRLQPDGNRPCRLVCANDSTASFEMLADASAGDLLASLGCSKPGISRILADQRLRADGRALLAGDRLLAGDTAVLTFSQSLKSVPPSDVPAEVLFEDRFMLAANKPAGILVHSDGTHAETLAERVSRHLADEGSAAAAQPVQRLDVETTGIVLFSLAEEFQPAFDQLVATNSARKRYIAIVQGAFPCEETTVCKPIGRDRHDAKRMRISPTGKPSETKIERLDVQGGMSLLRIELHSGRRHQIRVHLASMGYPVVGDRLYGGAACGDGLMLHAFEERFVHPVTGEEVGICTQWPARFERWFEEPTA